jgi:hypothetical protein
VLFQDFLFGFCPNERSRIGVVVLDVVADRFLEIGDGGEDAAADRSSGDDGEEVLDRIELQARGRPAMPLATQRAWRNIPPIV